jgi:hypothetical protein
MKKAIKKVAALIGMGLAAVPFWGPVSKKRADMKKGSVKKRS